MIRQGLLVALAGTFLLGGGVLVYATRDRGSADEVVQLGWVTDVLGDDAQLSALAGDPAGATYLVGGPTDVDALLGVRAAIAARPGGADVWTVVTSAGLDSIALESLRTRLVEAALDDGGGIALDALGVSCRALLGPLSGAAVVRVDAEKHIVSRAPLGAPEDVPLPGAGF